MVDLFKKLLPFLFIFTGCCHTKTTSDPMMNLFERINDLRIERRLPTLLVSENLNCIASIQAANMGFNRICDDIDINRSAAEVLEYSCGVEVEQQVVACGTTSVENTIKSWSASEDLKILEDQNFLLMGCAMHNFYWVCTFSY